MRSKLAWSRVEHARQLSVKVSKNSKNLFITADTVNYTVYIVVIKGSDLNNYSQINLEEKLNEISVAIKPEFGGLFAYYSCINYTELYTDCRISNLSLNRINCFIV